MDSLKSIRPTNTDLLLQHYRTNINIPSTDNMPEGQYAKYNQDINDFVKEQKLLMDHLKNFKTHIQHIVPMKEQELKYYKSFADFLQKYEEGSEKESTSLGENYKNIRLVSGDTKAHLKNKLDELNKDLLNPFKHIRNWVKGEMLNLEALMAAIGEKESCDVRKANSIKKLADEKELNAKLSQGKFTFKGMFKSKDSKARQQIAVLAKIQQRERDIENWDIVKRFLVVYLAEVAIPDFKKKKVSKYVFAMQNLSIDELSNSKSQQKCWADFYELTKAYSQDQ